jgi:hypothetical protein
LATSSGSSRIAVGSWLGSSTSASSSLAICSFFPSFARPRVVLSVSEWVWFVSLCFPVSLLSICLSLFALLLFSLVSLYAFFGAGVSFFLSVVWTLL